MMKDHDNVPLPKKAIKNTDEIKNALLSHSQALIKYVSRLRKYPYVCQTEKNNRIGINVIRNFYTDDEGNTMSDND